MSNHDSRATYIIICDGQTQLVTTFDIGERVRIAAATARNMVTYLGVVATDDLTAADTKPVSDCLHWFENNFDRAHKEDIEGKITELMAIVEGLHLKFAEY